MQLKILDRKPEPRSWEGNGVRREFFSQWAEFELDGIPVSFEFSGDVPLLPGLGHLSPRSFGMNGGRLAIGRAVVEQGAGEGITATVLDRPAERRTWSGEGRTSEWYEQVAVLECDGVRSPFTARSDAPLSPGPATFDYRSFSVVNGRLQVARSVILVPITKIVKPGASSAVAAPVKG